MSLALAREMTCAILDRSGVQDGSTDIGQFKIRLVRRQKPTSIEAQVFEPLVCFVLQGAKTTGSGRQNIRVAAGMSLTVSHAVPVISRIVDASVQTPYLALVLPLDLGLIHSLSADIGDDLPGGPATDAIRADAGSDDLLHALYRLMSSAEQPREDRILAPLIFREIHYRLLTGSGGNALRALATGNSNARRIDQVIRHIRKNLDRRLPTDELAQVAGMSPSGLHASFRAVTSTTPLQYQKDLRLLNARDLLQSGAPSVSTVAFQIGYESPTQFSREYSRKFGIPPRMDRTPATA